MCGSAPPISIQPCDRPHLTRNRKNTASAAIRNVRRNVINESSFSSRHSISGSTGPTISPLFIYPELEVPVTSVSDRNPLLGRLSKNTNFISYLQPGKLPMQNSGRTYRENRSLPRIHSSPPTESDCKQSSSKSIRQFRRSGIRSAGLCKRMAGRRQATLFNTDFRGNSFQHPLVINNAEGGGMRQLPSPCRTHGLIAKERPAYYCRPLSETEGAGKKPRARKSRAPNQNKTRTYRHKKYILAGCFLKGSRQNILSSVAGVSEKAPPRLTRPNPRFAPAPD